MRFFSTISGLWLSLLVAGSLGGCHRASYPLQSSVAASCQAVPSASASESAVVIMAARPEEQASASHQRHRRYQHSTRHVAKHHHVARIKSLLPDSYKAKNTAARSTAHSSRMQQEPRPEALPVRHRSRAIAVLLAALAITYLPLSLHNFYLGYYGRGAIALALVITGAYLVALGFLGSFFAGTGLVGLGVVGVILLAGWLGWQVSDFIRIISGDLKPKDGEYYPRFFQTRPDNPSSPTAK